MKDGRIRRCLSKRVDESLMWCKRVVFIDGEGVVILWSDEGDNNDGVMVECDDDVGGNGGVWWSVMMMLGLMVECGGV